MGAAAATTKALLTIETYKNDSKAYVKLEGRIVIETCAALRRSGEMHFSARHDQFIVNLENVSFMDSSGLGALVWLRMKCAEHKVRFVIMNPSQHVADVLSISRLDSVFEVLRGKDAEAIRTEMENRANRAIPSGTSAEGTETVDSSLSPIETRLTTSDIRSPQSRVSRLCDEALEKVRLGEYPQAVDLYHQALAIDPDCLSAMNNLALVYERRPVWTLRAMETWEKVLGLSRKLGDPSHQRRAEERLIRLRAQISDRG